MILQICRTYGAENLRPFTVETIPHAAGADWTVWPEKFNGVVESGWIPPDRWLFNAGFRMEQVLLMKQC